MQRYSSEFVARRYDRLARIYGFLEAIFMMRPGIRRATVDALELAPGETVLEVGCGTGANLDRLVEGVTPTGTVIGIDVSKAMVARAEALREGRGWKNVELTVQDAEQLGAGEGVDAVLFSLSYSVLSEQRRVLGHVWELLADGGRLAIMDARVPDGWLGTILAGPMRLLSRGSVLGDPHSQAETHLAELAGEVEVRRFRFGPYFLCVATKKRKDCLPA